MVPPSDVVSGAAPTAAHADVVAHDTAYGLDGPLCCVHVAPPSVVATMPFPTATHVEVDGHDTENS